MARRASMLILRVGTVAVVTAVGALLATHVLIVVLSAVGVAAGARQGWWPAVVAHVAMAGVSAYVLGGWWLGVVPDWAPGAAAGAQGLTLVGFEAYVRVRGRRRAMVGM